MRMCNISHEPLETGQPTRSPQTVNQLQARKKDEYYHCNLHRDSRLSILVLADFLVTVGMFSRAKTGSSQLLVRGLRYSNDE